jgi:AbrB family looped-hinge helix DNA binding protein
MRLLPGVSKIKLQDNYDNNKPRYRMSSNWELLSFQLFDGSKEKCCNSLHAPRKEIWFESLMKEFIATINSEGQVTIPAEIRKYLGITTNEKIAQEDRFFDAKHESK